MGHPLRPPPPPWQCAPRFVRGGARSEAGSTARGEARRRARGAQPPPPLVLRVPWPGKPCRPAALWCQSRCAPPPTHPPPPAAAGVKFFENWSAGRHCGVAARASTGKSPDKGFHGRVCNATIVDGGVDRTGCWLAARRAAAVLRVPRTDRASADRVGWVGGRSSRRERTHARSHGLC